MEVSDNDMKYMSALIFGLALVLLNTLPFIFRILNKTKEAKESDNFNLFIVVLNSYFYLLIVCTAITTMIHIIDLMDEVDYLNLLDSGGAISTFWTTGIDSSSSLSKTVTYMISWVRTLYEWLCIASMIVIMFFGIIGGYQYQKRTSAKSGYEADYLPFLGAVAGAFISSFLLMLYSEITKYALFLPDGKSILNVIREIITSSLGM